MLDDAITIGLIFFSFMFVVTGMIYLGTLNPYMVALMAMLKWSGIGTVLFGLMMWAHIAGMKKVAKKLNETKDE